MALPHPHGIDSGQIGHGYGVNVQIDHNDTPDTTGGKLIAVGEDGKSKNSNRGVWALSENIDYIYKNYAGSRTVPGVKTFVSTGTSYYNLTEFVFVGLPSYPIESLGMPRLFSVLSDRWATLQDPVLGGEVRVTTVRDVADVGTVYKLGDTAGFYPIVPAPPDPPPTPGVRLGFSLVDAPTGDILVADYVIPNATVVNIIFGAKGNYETLASDALLQVMINKTGVPAGVILQNGTRRMLQDLHLGGRSLRHVTDLNGDENQLAFRDVCAPYLNWFSEPIYGTQLSPASPAGHVSILGKLNSAIGGVDCSMPNRVVDKVGELVFDGMEGTVTIPTGNGYTINGESFITTNDPVVQLPWDDQDYYVVISHDDLTPALTYISASTVGSDLTENMVIIALANVSSAFGVFNYQSDLRTKGRHLNGKFEVFVGPDAQCDFSDLQRAVNYVHAQYQCLASPNLDGWRPRLVLRGVTDVSAIAGTVTLPVNSPYAWEIVGEGVGSGSVSSVYKGQALLRGAVGANSVSLEANGSVVHVRRVAFSPGSGTTTAGALAHLGSGSDLSECTFAGVLFGSNFSTAVVQGASAAQLTCRNCQFSSISSTAISNPGGKTVLEDCLFTEVSGSGGWVNTLGGGGSIQRCVFRTVGGAFLSLGIEPADGTDGMFEVAHNDFTGVGLSLVYPGSTAAGQFTVADNSFKNVIFSGRAAITGDNSNGSHSSGESGIGSTKAEICGNVFLGCITSIKFDMDQVESDNSNLVIYGNNIRQTFNTSDVMSFGIVLNNCGHFTVSDNTIAACATGVRALGFAHGAIRGNHFFNCTQYIVDIGAGPFAIDVDANTQTNDSASCGVSMRVASHPGCSFTRNTISVSGVGHTLTSGISVSDSNSTVVRGNAFTYTTSNTVYVSTSAGVRVEGNILRGSSGSWSSIYLVDSTDYHICDNTIRSEDGTTPIPGGGIYVTVSGGPSTCYGTISGNRLTHVVGVGQLSTSGVFSVIYCETTAGEPPKARVFVERNILDSCGCSGAGDNSSVFSIFVSGICQVNHNDIIDPQGSTTGRTTLQACISIQAQTPYVWSSIVHGNQIIINNTLGSSGGVGWYSTFVGIDMNQHGSVMGNTVVGQNPVVGDGSSAVRHGIRVGAERNVADVGNVTHNVSLPVGNGNINLSTGITVGNVGEVNTNGNLSAHASGNVPGV